MIAKKDDTEVKRAAALKIARSTVRLYFSVKADAALNDIIPEIEKRFDTAVAHRQVYEVTAADIVHELEARK